MPVGAAGRAGPPGWFASTWPRPADASRHARRLGRTALCCAGGRRCFPPPMPTYGTIPGLPRRPARPAEVRINRPKILKPSQESTNTQPSHRLPMQAPSPSLSLIVVRS